jgi:putative methyltransferase
MKNAILVQVVDSYGPNKFLPLAIAYQWLNALQDPHIANEWQLQDVLIEKVNIDEYVDSIEHKPDMMAMSCYVWNWEYNCRLAKTLKKKFPDCKIIIGGPQVDKQDENLLHKHNYFDVAILGENEIGFNEVVKNLDSGQFEHIPGISIPGLITNQPVRTRDLNKLPSPILTGFYDWIMSRYDDPDIMWQVTYETMRGCPYQCGFCDIGDKYWNKTISFDIDRVHEEIDWMSDRKIEYVSVCDSNWGIWERDLDITKYVIEKKLGNGYPKFWDVTWAKNNTERIKQIALADKEAGTQLFKGITFAVQSMNKPTLDATKRFNLKENVIEGAMDFYRQNDIPTYSEMIWPMPNETVESLMDGAQKLIDMGQKDFLMVHPLVLTPNALMGQSNYIRMNGLEYESVPLDTFWLNDEDNGRVTEYVDAVYATNSANYEEMISGHLHAHWLITLYYYGWGHVLMDYLNKVSDINHTQFIELFIQSLLENPDTMIYQEHIETAQSIREVFDSKNLWGRKIDGIFWEYKSATSVKFHRDRAKLLSEMKEIVSNFSDVPDKVYEINSRICADWREIYPFTLNVDPELCEILFDTASDKIEISHLDCNNIDNESDFIRVAYHYQRKNRYWRCSIQPVEQTQSHQLSQSDHSQLRVVGVG